MPPSISCQQVFFLFSIFFTVEEPFLPFLFVFVGLFYMYERVVAEHLRIYRKHSTAQSALHKAANQARADQSTTTQASIQIWREPAYRQAFIQLATFSKRTKEIKICPAYKNIHSQRSLADVMRERFAFTPSLNEIQHCSFSQSFLCISYMHAASGLLYPGAWSSWHYLQVVSLQLKSWTCLPAS